MRRIALIIILFFFSLPTLAQDDPTPTPYEIALQRIHEAEASGATSLDFESLGLTELPSEIGHSINCNFFL